MQIGKSTHSRIIQGIKEIAISTDEISQNNGSNSHVDLNQII
jgi:hypothetical protein